MPCVGSVMHIQDLWALINMSSIITASKTFLRNLNFFIAEVLLASILFLVYSFFLSFNTFCPILVGDVTHTCFGVPNQEAIYTCKITENKEVMEHGILF
jgi:hypothetical protein